MMHGMWKPVLIAVAASLITGAVSGWLSSEKTVSALAVHIEWLKDGLRVHELRIAELERRLR